jgi:predicted metalloprotease
MRWKRGRGRDQIEDRRGQRGAGRLGGGLGGGLGRGGGFPIPGGRGGLGVGGVVLVLIVLVVLYFTGAFGGGSGSGTDVAPDGPAVSGAPDPDAKLVDFVGFVVNDVQNFWRADFRTDGRTYETTKIVLFTSQTQSGCGVADEQTGPFYCPVDHKVYLDLGFFRELASRFSAPGDFAQAYVIAHEFGHHVQTLLGTEERVRRETQQHPGQANELSVRLELQADCYAGVWAHQAYTENLLEPGDMDEALRAAAAVGDDRIQRSAGQRVNPETWTHGSAAQRSQWLRTGFRSGDPRSCDTFSASV